MATEFIELAGKINQQMPSHCVQRIERALNEAEKPIKGSRIALLGVSYKGGTGDIRESPALRIISELAERGAVVTYHDPFVPRADRVRPRSQRARRVRRWTPMRLSSSRPIPGSTTTRSPSTRRVFVDLRGVTRRARLDRSPSSAARRCRSDSGASQPSEVRTILAGFPITTASFGTSLVTTAPAPTIARSPIVMPGSTTAPAPIVAPRRIVVELERERLPAAREAIVRECCLRPDEDVVLDADPVPQVHA